MKRLLLALLAAGCAASETVRVELDFTRPVMQIDAAEGASVCQFHGSDPERGTVSAARTYATLGGFPDDSPSTEFGRFCDTAFSTLGAQGMGLSQVWSTPAGPQTPAGAVGDHYSAEAWSRLDFSMYEPLELPRDRYLSKTGTPVRGHTVPMLLAALKRARSENQRILFWNDLHTDYPTWMWKDRLRKNPIPEQLWEEAALHVVYYAKYLTARHGVPVHTVSLQNEPDLPARHGFTPEMLLRMTRILRERLDEAGLYGVRIMPFTSVVLGRTTIPWLGREVANLERTAELLEGTHREYADYVDSLGGHLSHGEDPLAARSRNTRFWRASGDFDTHWKGPDSVIFDMGPDDQIDEVIRTNTWLYGKGVSLAGIWQVALRMGHTVDDFVMPERFDVEKHFRRAAIDGAATVFPYVRPGMSVVTGSLGSAPRAPYSVDGFGGRGHRDAIVITNSGTGRSFEISVRGAGGRFEVFQATSASGKKQLPDVVAVASRVSVEVPGDSVTTLVAKAASTRPRVYVIVKDRDKPTRDEAALLRSLSERFDPELLPQTLSIADQDRLLTKRHPVDPMGAAAYVLSESVDRRETAYAYRTVMAPVVAVGEANRIAMGVNRLASVRGGERLAFRDPLDPPASMLAGGVPLACGPRAHVAEISRVPEVLR